MAIAFDSRIQDVQILADGEMPRPDAQRVRWLVPGFINAHCHLEYSWLGAAGSEHALPRGKTLFGEWMQAIIAARPGSQDDLERRKDAMTDAAQTLLRGGCTTVIDSTTDGESATHLSRAGVRYFLFHEVLGLSQERAEPLWRALMVRLAGKGARDASPWLIGHGINPHAPYSVGPWLRGKLRGAEVAKFSQAWHLGETPDEEELFLKGEGSIAGFLKARRMPFPGSAPASTRSSGVSDGSDPSFPGVSAFQFLNLENQLPRCQVAFHGNTLTLPEAAFFTDDRALVHCPATHRWFAREPAALRAWLDAGVNVCLGTDSLASSETLSMLDVVRMTLTDNLDLSADDVLQMACTNPARISFMRDSGLTGLLQPGSPADFVAVETPESDSNWRDVLSQRETRMKSLWVAGAKK